MIAAETLFTPSEAAALCGVSEKQVRKEIDHGLLEPAAREPLRLALAALVYVDVVRHLGFDIGVDRRRRLLAVISKALASREKRVAVYDVFELRLDRVLDELEARRERLAEWRRTRIMSDRQVLAGEEVFRGTRLGVRQIGGMIERGASVGEVLEDYPDMSREDVEFAAQYVRAYPRVGRPPR